jgi:hypothetical protein
MLPDRDFVSGIIVMESAYPTIAPPAKSPTVALHQLGKALLFPGAELASARAHPNRWIWSAMTV